ncbi:G-protein coupled receptor dmsr-1-like [Mytilus trossulus]|uniref:G-protein coupled receptor dmsr-1-like n=1 Tax=Mytilus trossulus TaxID=6551 RepID=UPI003005C1B7
MESLNSSGPNFTDGVVGNNEFVVFSEKYSQYHGYISSFICLFGVVSNILNIIVLTRKHMISPTNLILTALALADVMTMSVYLVYALYLYVFTLPRDTYGHSKGWMYFVVVNNLVVITCHNMAMWLTVSLAVFRYIFVCHHVVANQLCSLERAKLTIGIVVVVTILLCIPNYFMYRVYELAEYQPNYTGYWIDLSLFAQSHSLYQPITFWIYGVIIKIAPCVLLTILSACIICAMHEASKRRQRLLQQAGRHNEETSAEHNRTTMMLVAVVLFFVITEFPQGILAGISGLNPNFFQTVYSNLGDIMDLLVLLNSAINFILYCIMSQQFRDTFTNLFVCNFISLRNVHSAKQNGMAYSTVTTEVTQV